MDKSKSRKLAKWIIGVVTACILIYLAIRHLNVIGAGISWIADIISPLLLGIAIALILNVPMRPIENHLYPNTQNAKAQKARRPLAILLSLMLVLGILIGVAFLVIPEIIKAIRLIAQIILSGIDRAALLEDSLDFTQLPFGEYLEQIDINWAELKDKLEKWTIEQQNGLIRQTAKAVSSVATIIINFFMGLAFSIYILANKENLKRQALRLTQVWLPQKLGNVLIHIFSVCNKSLRDFIAGQATEAVILGTLCTIGMLILRLPYAPMIGALVGITALIPVIGAYLGAFVGAFMILTINPLKAFIFIVFLCVLQQIEGNIIYPRVVGAKINLPAMWVLAAVIVGGNLAGPVGMLLGVPAASAAYALLKEATTKREQVLHEDWSSHEN